MKKIMFNDHYGLTQAVLEGRKTMTRRIITCPKTFKGEWVAGFNVYRRQSDGKIIDYPCMYDADEFPFDGGAILPTYKPGEIVAVAQAYNDFFNDELNPLVYPNGGPGWTNKMFVKADLMPHRIRFDDFKIERLQDISDDDCLKEGLEYDCKAKLFYVNYNRNTGSKIWLDKSPQTSFGILIDKISGKGTWNSNPFVYAYKFKLII